MSKNIDEKLLSFEDTESQNNDLDNLNFVTTYNYYPKTRDELQDLIKKLIKERGNKADLNDICTSQITDMNNLFSYSDFNGDISKWDVHNVKIMYSMFYGSSFNGDISKWNVSNVKSMIYMFAYTSFNGDISKWDVHNVKYMNGMFYDSDFNGDISNWDVSNVESMHAMFYNSQFNGDISKWNINPNCNTKNANFPNKEINEKLLSFEDTETEDKDLDNLNFVTTYNYYPKDRDELGELILKLRIERGKNGDLNDICTSQITDMSSLFSYSVFNGDISKWDVSNVENMAGMFYNSNFNSDISKWDVSKVKDMSNMFAWSNFNGDISNWDVSNVEWMNGIFFNSMFNGDISKWKINSNCNTSNARLPKKKVNEKLLSFEDIESENNDLENLNKLTKYNYYPKTIDELDKLVNKLIAERGDNADLNDIYTGDITDMSWLFYKPSNNFNGDISKWDVSKVEDMSYMFYTSSFNGNISKWNVSKVKNMEHMFADSPFNRDISKWDVSNVEDMDCMFASNRAFNGDISKWDVSKVKNMAGMFAHSDFNRDISDWDVHNVKNMNSMFYDSAFNGNISNWDVSNVENMSNIFSKSRFNRDISNWNINPNCNTRDANFPKKTINEKLLSFEDIESENNDLENLNELTKYNYYPKDRIELYNLIKNLIKERGNKADLNDICTSQITDMRNLFTNSEFNGDISKWDVSNVENMYAMFYSASFKGDISDWNVSNVKNMSFMFTYSPFNGDISKWDVHNVRYVSGMFQNSKFNGDISNWDVSNVENMTYMFFGSSFNGDVSKWNINPECNIFNANFPNKEMNEKLLSFEDTETEDKDLENLNELTKYKYYPKYTQELKGLVNKLIEERGINADLNDIYTGDITDMGWLFYDYNFNGDISKWDVSNVTRMNYMFSGSSFNGDISNWDVSNVVTMSNMFWNADFNGDISKWDVHNVRYMSGMFQNSKFNGDISNWDVSKVINMAYMFFGSSFNGDISKWKNDINRNCNIYKANFPNKEMNEKLLSFEDTESEDNDLENLNEITKIAERKKWLEEFKRPNYKGITINPFLNSYSRTGSRYTEECAKYELYEDKKNDAVYINKLNYKPLADETGEFVFSSSSFWYYDGFGFYIAHRKMNRHGNRINFVNFDGKLFFKEDIYTIKKVICCCQENIFICVKPLKETNDYIINQNGDVYSFLKQYNVYNLANEYDSNKEFLSMFENTCLNVNDDDFFNKLRSLEAKEMNEKLLSFEDIDSENNDLENLNKLSKYNYYPKDRYELERIVNKLIEERGNNADLNDICTSQITDMYDIFDESKFNGDISKWDVSNVKSMACMFYNSAFNGDISKWDVSNVENMVAMFQSSKFNGDISNWDVSNVKDMYSMFYLSAFNGDISKWKINPKCDTRKAHFPKKETINEKLLSFEDTEPKDNDLENLNKLSKYNYYPKDKEELGELIIKLIAERGDKANLNDICTSQITDMSSMFFWSKFNGDISEWDVSKVEDMKFMFAGSDFNGDISKWNVSNVKNMKAMFRYSRSFNGDLSKWDVSKVEDMKFMFSNSKFNGDISKWDVSKVKDMAYLFYSSSFNGDVSKWNINPKCNTRCASFPKKTMNEKLLSFEDIETEDKDLENLNKLSKYKYFPKTHVELNRIVDELIKERGNKADLNDIYTGDITDMSHLFFCSDFNGDISKWVVSNVEDMGYMFASSKFNGDISKWDVSKVTNMACMFADSPFNGDISKWDVSNVEDMGFMFYENKKFNGDISKWNVSKVEDLRYIFADSKFKGDISKWNIKSKCDTYCANFPKKKKVNEKLLSFEDTESEDKDLKNLNELTKYNYYPKTRTELIGLIDKLIEERGNNADLNDICTSHITNMSHLFYQSQFNGDISKWDVSNVEDMFTMFTYSKFNGDISKWDVSKVEDMRSIFYRSKFNGDISNWNVSNVINMAYMFYHSQFNGDISKWDVSKVEDMRSMFAFSKFNGDISNWNVSNVTNMAYMFYHSQFNGDISKWNINPNCNTHAFTGLPNKKVNEKLLSFEDTESKDNDLENLKNIDNVSARKKEFEKNWQYIGDDRYECNDLYRRVAKYKKFGSSRFIETCNFLINNGSYELLFPLTDEYQFHSVTRLTYLGPKYNLYAARVSRIKEDKNNPLKIRPAGGVAFFEYNIIFNDGTFLFPEWVSKYYILPVIAMDKIGQTEEPFFNIRSTETGTTFRFYFNGDIVDVSHRPCVKLPKDMTIEEYCKQKLNNESI